MKLRHVLDRWIRAPNGPKDGSVRASDKNILPAGFVAQHGLNNFCDLPGCFPFPKNDFGISLAQRAVMIHFGEAQILKRQILQPGNGTIGWERSESDEIQ
jgi:hypothetical protein